MQAELIAPCGMNCAICSGHLRKKDPCPGCGGNDENKPDYCRSCKVVVCEKRKESRSGFCYECSSYPCTRIKQLDKRYSAKYHMSMMENLAMMKEQGMAAFLEKETEKWKCPVCGGVVCCHNGLCYDCLDNAPKSKRKPIPEKDVTGEDLIAPCGMNCGVCASYLAMKNDVKSRGIKMSYCRGCLPRGKGCSVNKSLGCLKLMGASVRFCLECEKFPCATNERIDSTYRERYGMSPVENLRYIGEHGIEKFLEREREKWRCPECGGVISCHNGICFTCGLEKLKNRKNKYSRADDA